ncbi:MAG: thiolase family protein [Chloroflexi bacterium]|nr:thiolase family protein [Chloroflexota bacterium]
MSDKSLFGKAAIVGLGSTDFRALHQVNDPERTSEEMAIAALRDALTDAGLRLQDIDGLVVGGIANYEPFAYRSGLRNVRFLGHYPSAGRFCSVALAHAAMAVHHGLANYVALFNSLAFRTQGRKFGGGEYPGDLYNSIYGMTSPGALYSLAFTRYLGLYGGEPDDLGEIAVAIRNHATLNPEAILQQKLTLDDYRQARYIAKPLRLLDYCLVNDGAVCYIVTTKERARALKQPPVLLASTAERATMYEQYVPEDFWWDACQTLRHDLFDTIGMKIEDIDSLQVYDNFSVSALWMLEGFGFAPRGEGLKWARGGRISLGGELPLNTSGGMLAESYLQGWNNHAEAIRQLRGQAGKRQIPDCRAVLYCCLSAVPGGDILIKDDR